MNTPESIKSKIITALKNDDRIWNEEKRNVEI